MSKSLETFIGNVEIIIITQELKELRVPYLLDKGAGAGKEVEIK
ncbi:hypothetical protein [Dictyoglomus turgidum]|nr:hypothetical protein [Dictyoglomus turgidum]